MSSFTQYDISFKNDSEEIVLSLEDIRIHVNNTIETSRYSDLSKYAILATSLCIENKVPVHLFLSLIKMESDFRYDAINQNKNGSFDIGLGQLNTYTFKNYSKKELENPRINLKLSIKTLKDLHSYFGSWEQALAAYNAGISRVVKDEIPESTQRYVKKVLDFEESLNMNYLNYERRSSI